MIGTDGWTFRSYPMRNEAAELIPNIYTFYAVSTSLNAMFSLDFISHNKDLSLIFHIDAWNTTEISRAKLNKSKLFVTCGIISKYP
jgi:hypothetical protein